LYRCIGKKVNYMYDPNKGEKNNCYCINDTKTFWAFSSCSLERDLNFLKKKIMVIKKEPFLQYLEMFGNMKFLYLMYVVKMKFY